MSKAAISVRLCKIILLLILYSVQGFHAGWTLSNQVTPTKNRSRMHPALIFLRRPNNFNDDDYNDGNDEYSYGEEEFASAPSTTGKRPLRRPIRPVRTSGGQDKRTEKRREEAQARHREALKDPTLLTKIHFADRPDIHPLTKRAVTEILGLQSMTEIQAQTYAEALGGNSVIGRARTGVGKTLAFLLPSIERLLGADLELYQPRRNIGVIIVAPTRELVIQIADQADALLTFHPDLKVAALYGGTRIQRDLRLLHGSSNNNQLPSIVVATPGRLLEHLENTRIGGRKFQDIAQETKIVVLDEADRLFEAFQRECQKILSYLPRADKRQTLLFSATMPSHTRAIVKKLIKTEFIEIDCVGSKGTESETNIRVNQSYLMLEDMKAYIPTLVAIIQHNKKANDDYKILVFFPASKLVRFFSNLFNVGLNIPVLEIHSRMSQSSRKRASDEFREGKQAILFTSDVSARGIDYPDVTLVVQYGAPSNDRAYIHRLGRTARAGKEGKGLVVLLPFERNALNTLRNRRVVEDSDMAAAVQKERDQVDARLEPSSIQIRSGHAVLTPNAEAAYKAFLAYYAAKSDGVSPLGIFEQANEFGYSTGLSVLPRIEPKVAKRLGIGGLFEGDD